MNKGFKTQKNIPTPHNPQFNGLKNRSIDFQWKNTARL